VERVPLRSEGFCTSRMFVFVSVMAACMTWKAVGDLPVLYCKMRARERPGCCACAALFIPP